MASIYYFTRFKPDQHSHGGDRRCFQVCEALKGEQLRVFTFDELQKDGLLSKVNVKPVKRAYQSLHSGLNQIGLSFWKGEYASMVGAYKFTAKTWAKKLAELPRPDCILIDDPIYFSGFIKEAKQRGLKVVGVAHNLETLGTGMVYQDAVEKALQVEVQALRLCNLLISISESEDLFFKQCQIPSIYFPYLPAEEVIENLNLIRSNRRLSKKRGFLMLGTVLNNPTKKGVLTFLKKWNSTSKENKEPIVLAGFGTDKLNLPENYDQVEILGSLSKQQLLDVLSTTKACVCHQVFGAGALTRIPELLIANVPVLANDIASRNYQRYDGVKTYTDMDSFFEIAEDPDSFTKPDGTEIYFPLEELDAKKKLMKALHDLID